MSIIESLFGQPDPEAPVVIFIDGDLDGEHARGNFVETLRRELAFAEALGTLDGLEHALDLLGSALSTRMFERSIVVARGGTRPIVWEVPGVALETAPARLIVRDEPPAWLEQVLQDANETPDPHDDDGFDPNMRTAA